MKTKLHSFAFASYVMAALLCALSNRAGSLDWEQWFGVPGTSVQDLFDSGVLDFPPDIVDSISESFDTFEVLGTDNVDDSYGSRIRGFIQAPETGRYTLFLRTDDAGQLFTSVSHDPSRKRLSAQETGCCAPLFSGARLDQRSTTLNMVKGRSFYIEVLHNEGAGGDYIEVGWQRPDGTQEIIPGLYLLRYAPENTAPRIDQDPSPQFVSEGEQATFSVTVSVAQPATFQWFRNGQPIDGAICQTYKLETATLADSGVRFSCEITAPGRATATSGTAALTVSSDSAPPALISARTRGNPNGVEITFSEPVSDTTVAAAAQLFEIDNGVTIESASFGSKPNVLLLQTGTIQDGVAHTLTVKDVTDRAASANTISPNPSTVAISQAHGVITRRVFLDIPGKLLSDLTTHGRFPDRPDILDYPAVLETPAQVGDNYGVQFIGYFIPPVSGEYTFYLSTGNEGALFLSSDADPANKVRIASENESFIPPRTWIEDGLRPDRENISDPQTLAAGERYYIEALMKAGAEFGGTGAREDNLAIAVQLPSDPPPDNGGPPISGEMLSAFTMSGPITLVSQPTSVSVEELRSASFSVTVDGTPPYAYQWFKNNVILPGEDAPHLNLSAVPLEDTGVSVTVKVSNSFSETTSQASIITVRKDVSPPRVSKVTALNINTSAAVEFNEPVEQSAAENIANYSIEPGITISAAQLLPDLKTVTLSTSALNSGTDYTLTLNGIPDKAGDPNMIAANSQKQFQFFGSDRVSSGLLALYTFQEGSGTTVRDWSGVGVPLNLEIENPENVSWLPDGGLSVVKETRIVSTTSARKISSTARKSGQLTIEVWTQSSDPDQDGPARIVSMSEGSGGGDRNFSLNQGMWNQNAPESLRWSLRLSQNSNGGDTWLTEAGMVDTERRQHVVATVNTALPADQATIYVDGEEAAVFSTQGDFSDFLDNRLLVFANENSLVGSGRRYLGDLFLIALYDRALTPDDVRKNFGVGPIKIIVPEDEEPIRLDVSRSGGDVVISWEGAGTLIASPTIDGTFSPVSNASSPFVVTPAETMYYRIEQ